MPTDQRARRRPPVRTALVGLLLGVVLICCGGSAAGAQTAPTGPTLPQPEITVPTPPTPGGVTDTTAADTGGVQIGISTGDGEAPSQSILLLIGLSVLSLAPSLVILLSSFTRIVIVLSLTRNALGLQGIPPNQVLIGLALVLSLFVMAPTLDEINEKALQPYLAGQMEQGAAFEAASKPI